MAEPCPGTYLPRARTPTAWWRTACELAAPLDMSLPSVVPDLDVLERSGLVRSETVGRVRACRLEPGSMRALDGTRLVEAAPGERRAPPARLAAW